MEIRSSTAEPSHSPKKQMLFGMVIVVIIAAAIVRSSITTSLDGFTFDEAYHIGAGLSYVQTGDFRINPEHPPLTKLWVGTYLAFFDHQLTPFRPLSDKIDERGFVENDIFNTNDPDVVQNRSRTAMFALNALLLMIFVGSVWRVLGPLMAVGAAAFLAIDPTVAAHLPVVMTDLPVALLSGTAVLLSVRAFTEWKAADLLMASAALGLALAAKHSAVITVIAVAIIGVVGIGFALDKTFGMASRLRRVGFVASVLLGSVILLWAFYGFRYNESPGSNTDNFNRPLYDKIADVQSPLLRFGLTTMVDYRLAPRAYSWGLADTIRAGAEGRVGDVLVFGQLYYRKAPWFYFPGVLAVKIPIGLLLLSLAGLVLLAVSPTTRPALPYVAGLLLLALLFLFFLVRGSSYGGVRHMLPMFPLLIILAAIPFKWAVERRSAAAVGAVTIALLAAAVSAVPVMRPWEYYNEFIGGTANGHRYFDDEGVDIYQRYKEAVSYYHAELAPRGENPYTFYLLPRINDPARSIDYVSSSKERDRGKWDGPFATGTFIVGANEIAPALWWDKASFREAEPIARFGNLFVFRGTFDIRPMRGQGLAYQAMFYVFGPEPDIERAIAMLTEAAAIDPRAFFVSLELGNLHLRQGRREEALGFYRSALENMPADDPQRADLVRQVELVQTEPLESIRPLRNPGLE